MTNKQELERAIKETRTLRDRLLCDIQSVNVKLEELEKLAAKADEPEQKKEWRQKPEQGDEYLYIDSNGDLVNTLWDGGTLDDFRYKNCNCFPCKLFTEEQVQQIAWQNQLNSLLTQYAIINGALASEEEKKDDIIPLYWAEEGCDGEFSIDPLYSQNPLVVKFNKGDVASQAFEDVIKPFCREHPEFVW